MMVWRRAFWRHVVVGERAEHRTTGLLRAIYAVTETLSFHFALKIKAA